MHWAWISLAYLVYLACASLMRREFAAIRGRVFAGTFFLAAMCLILRLPAVPTTPFRIVVPALVLLFGYQLSGLFFVRVDWVIEQRLLRLDRRLLFDTGVLGWCRHAPALLDESLELTYLLVYTALPAGAVLLASTGHSTAIDRYWTIVLGAEFLCYGALPWIQTRPPMLLEADSHHREGIVRRVNQVIAARASIRANTIPSGHAAGAVAAALAIGTVLPMAGALFLLLALSIATASVVGRYHYLLDSVLGVLVAVAAWASISAFMR